MSPRLRTPPGHTSPAHRLPGVCSLVPADGTSLMSTARSWIRASRWPTLRNAAIAAPRLSAGIAAPTGTFGYDDAGGGRALTQLERLIVADIVDVVTDADFEIRHATSTRPARFVDQEPEDDRLWLAALLPNGRYRIRGASLGTYRADQLDFQDEQAAAEFRAFLYELITGKGSRPPLVTRTPPTARLHASTNQSADGMPERESVFVSLSSDRMTPNVFCCEHFGASTREQIKQFEAISEQLIRHYVPASLHSPGQGGCDERGGVSGGR